MIALKFIFLSIYLFVIIILIKIKISFKKRKNINNKISYANGQVIGTEQFQNDYFSFIKRNNQQKVLAVVADGVTRKKIGKTISVIAVSVLKTNFINRVHDYDSEKYFKVCYDEMDKTYKDNVTVNTIRACLIAVLIKNIWLEWSSIGNCALFLYRNNRIKLINDINKSEPLFGKFRIEKDDILVLCSKGIYANLWELDLEAEVSRNIPTEEKMNNILKRVRNKNLKQQDNATLIIIENIINVR